jgi:predicted ATPase
LSGVNSASHSTALAVRREMQSWRLLQLEPTSLRKPDDYSGDAHISSVGEHMPNTLMRLEKNAQVASRLAELIPGVVTVDVDSDEVRQQRTVQVTMQGRQRYSASSLSDGTLRFLALAVLAEDPAATGLTCMEEPENGIHPSRIPEMLRLVRDLSDADLDVGDWDGRGAIRQVVINTHSPLVVAELPDGELLMAETLRIRGATFINFKPLNDTWRAAHIAPPPSGTITRGELQGYLSGSTRASAPTGVKRVRDHLTPDLFNAS